MPHEKALAVNKETQLHDSRAGSVVAALLVCASLGLNAFLVAKLLQRRPSLPPPAASAVARPVGKSPPRAAAATPASRSAAAPATSAPPAFLWSQIESTDYRQYIANLRAVGCPELIIRDTIMADLNQLFAPRAATIWKPRVREYWQKSKDEQPSPEQEEQLLALSKEKTAVLQELLGVRLGERRMRDTVYLLVYGSERDLLFLPADKRAAALQALADADPERKADELDLPGGGGLTAYRALEQKRFDETLQTLAKVLSPAELEEFRLRGSPTADALRNEVQYFNCTPEEFRQLADSREDAGEGYKNPGELEASYMDRTAATEEVRKFFGDERAKEFERVTDPCYIRTRRAAEEQGVPLERVDQAWEVIRDARAAVGLVWKSTNLAGQEKNRQTQALVQQAEARLNELVGQKAARGVRFFPVDSYFGKPSP